MRKQSTQYHGYFGVNFTVSKFTVLPSDSLSPGHLHFLEAGSESWRVYDLIVATYDRMLAQQRPCEMVAAISSPLTRQQAELFNAQNVALAAAVSAAVGAVLPFQRRDVIALASGAAGFSVGLALESRHAGDVIVAIQAWVAGGIGPQHRSTGMLLKADGGVR